MNTLPNDLAAMDYDAFAALMRTPRGSSVLLDTNAALSLCRNGYVRTKAPLVWLGAFWIALIAAIPTVYFGSWQFAPACLFLLWLAARRSKSSAVAAVWRELKGLGSLPPEQRAAIYAHLVEQNMLVLQPEKHS